MIQQRDLVGGLDRADVLHQPVPVLDAQPLAFQCPQNRQLNDIHPDRPVGQSGVAEQPGQPGGVARLDAHVLRDGPRQLEMPACQLPRPYHGAYRWWVRADEPMSHRIGSWPRITSAQRKNLSRAQFPMWVAVA